MPKIKHTNESVQDTNASSTDTVVAIHQLHYLPWLRYFDKILKADIFIVLDNIQFNKNGWQNRNKIHSASGPLLLTVPVYSRFQQTLDQVTINNTVNWQKKHWRAIQQSYAKAPYFKLHHDFLQDTYAREWRYLNDLNRHMLAYFLDILKSDTRVEYASSLNVPGEATERLIHLMQAVGGTHYYSGAFALETYLDAEQLHRANINLLLQEWEAPVYPQCHVPFAPDLSILDLLMNCGPDARSILLGEQAC